MPTCSDGYRNAHINVVRLIETTFFSLSLSLARHFVEIMCNFRLSQFSRCELTWLRSTPFQTTNPESLKLQRDFSERYISKNCQNEVEWRWDFALNWNQIQRMEAAIITREKKLLRFRSLIRSPVRHSSSTSLRFVVINKTDDNNKNKQKRSTGDRESKRKRIFWLLDTAKCNSSPKTDSSPQTMRSDVNVAYFFLFVFSSRFSSEKIVFLFFRLNAFCLQKTTDYTQSLWLCALSGSALCTQSVYKHTQTRS